MRRGAAAGSPRPTGIADFPIQNLPLGVFAPRGEARRAAASRSATRSSISPRRSSSACSTASQRQAARGRVRRRRSIRCSRSAARPRAALRHRVGEILDADGTDRARIEAARPRLLHRAADCRLELPAAIGDYTDFFAGIHHATNAGKLFRPDNPLLPNYKYVPIGYHGRASSIAVSGGKVRRPERPAQAGERAVPSFGPSRNLDYELELGVWIGPGNALGTPIPIGEAADHIAGFCLLNDWSARDIQAWEYQPLGPFLGKSFHHHRVALGGHARGAGAVSDGAGEPRPPATLRRCPTFSDASDQATGALDIDLEVFLLTEGLRVEWACAASAVGRQRPPSLLDGRPARRPSQLRRLQSAAGRPVRDRHDLRPRRRRASAACSKSPPGAGSR